MRPAEVCGLAMKPSSSRSDITLRTVAGESLRPGIAGQGPRAHRLAFGNVVLDQGLEEDLGALVEAGHGGQGRVPGILRKAGGS